MTIGNRIKMLREERGISQYELATMIGYSSRSSINKIELNQRGVPIEKLNSLAEALGTTPNTLLGWKEDDEQ